MVRIGVLAMTWTMALACGETATSGPPSDDPPCAEGWTAGVCLGEQAGEDCADFSADAVEQQANSWSMAMADLCGNQYTFDQDDAGQSADFIECFVLGYDEAYAEWPCD